MSCPPYQAQLLYIYQTRTIWGIFVAYACKNKHVPRNAPISAAVDIYIADVLEMGDFLVSS